MTSSRRIILASALLALALVTPAHAATPGKNGKVVYIDDGLVVRAICTGDPVTILPAERDPEAPRWSADGLRLLVGMTPEGQDVEQIAVLDPDGTDVLVITDFPNGVGPASWSPDGTRVVVSQYPDTDDREQLFIAKADGSGVTPLTFPGVDEYDFYPAWSPDGRTIAFTQAPEGGDDDIELISPDGTHRREFAASAADEYSPAWSPNGRWIAYSRGQDVVVKPAAGGPRILIAVNAGGADWSPDGRWVIYEASRETYGTYKRKADGTGPEILLVAGASELSWQPLCNLTGNDRANTLVGTAKSELICGKGGRDTINGKGGLDIVFAGSGGDTVAGGDGNDVLVGQQGDDRFNGGTGKDRCVQGPGSGSKTACES